MKEKARSHGLQDRVRITAVKGRSEASGRVGTEHYDYCPALKRHHWLLPFYWVYRAFRMILCKERRSRIFHEVKIVKKSGKRGGRCDFISNGR